MNCRLLLWVVLLFSSKMAFSNPFFATVENGAESSQARFTNLSLDALIGEVISRDTMSDSCPDGGGQEISEREAEKIAWRAYFARSNAKRRRGDVFATVTKIPGKCVYIVFIDILGKENAMPPGRTTVHMSSRIGAIYAIMDPR